MQPHVAYPPDASPIVREQLDYLEGVLWADPEHRLDPDPTRDVGREIDPHGTCNHHFWRGVLEAAGTMAISPNRGTCTYPYVVLKGSHSFLTKFLAFCNEEINQMKGVPWAWDADGALAFQASGGKVKVTGTKAQEVVRVLYGNSTVGLHSFRDRADEIWNWTPRR